MVGLSFDPDQLVLPQASFIDGKPFVGCGHDIEVRRPSDGKLMHSFREVSGSDVDYAVTTADRAFRTSGWATGEPRARSRVMRRWADLIEQHGDELAQIEAALSSRPIAETRTRDVPVTAEIIRFYGECAARMDGEVLASRSDVYSLTIPEPYGVVAAISPWNVPMILAMIKVAPALAAGNAVVIKPSELTPFSLLRIAELAIEAGIPPGLFNVVIGTGSETGSALIRHPLVRYVSFTGSTATGVSVMTTAAQHGMKPVSLELGGKNPQIVFADAPDLEQVARIVANAATRNSGQLCFCGSRLIVERKIRDQFLSAVSVAMSSAVAGPTWQETTSLPPIISEAQRGRVAGIVSRALAQGAEALTGGRAFDRDGGHFYEPTLVTCQSNTNPIFEEEVFGPVLAVQTFDDPEEAIKLADHPFYGLTAGIHTTNINRALRTAKAVDAGMIWINSYGRSMDIASPFGGHKQSGMGKDFGVAGFEKYLNKKSVWIQLT
ncbi:aldehyde dehydrogenase family protein [Tardiphaga sp.]|jgi:aldehyde dehydrogenase (NAD+)|uniref:aldehyde dehydrogenase family protein n=1 Tax=Tardiphaga sp. TaxID=1926292 RepID=UPI0037DA3D3F